MTSIRRHAGGGLVQTRREFGQERKKLPRKKVTGQSNPAARGALLSFTEWLCGVAVIQPVAKLGHGHFVQGTKPISGLAVGKG